MKGKNNMQQEEIKQVLEELNTVRPEVLTDNGKRLFDAIMKIADERDYLQRRTEEAIKYCNNNIELTPRLIDVISILKGNDE